MYAKTIAGLRETRKAVKDPREARGVDEQIAGLEKERAALRRPEEVPPSVMANSKRVAARRAEIEGRP